MRCRNGARVADDQRTKAPEIRARATSGTRLRQQLRHWLFGTDLFSYSNFQV